MLGGEQKATAARGRGGGELCRAFQRPDRARSPIRGAARRGALPRARRRSSSSIPTIGLGAVPGTTVRLVGQDCGERGVGGVPAADRLRCRMPERTSGCRNWTCSRRTRRAGVDGRVEHGDADRVASERGAAARISAGRRIVDGGYEQRVFGRTRQIGEPRGKGAFEPSRERHEAGGCGRLRRRVRATPGSSTRASGLPAASCRIALSPRRRGRRRARRAACAPPGRRDRRGRARAGRPVAADRDVRRGSCARSRPAHSPGGGPRTRAPRWVGLSSHCTSSTSEQHGVGARLGQQGQRGERDKERLRRGSVGEGEGREQRGALSGR